MMTFLCRPLFCMISMIANDRSDALDMKLNLKMFKIFIANKKK